MGSSFSQFHKQSPDQRNRAKRHDETAREARAPSRKSLKERLRRFTHEPAVPYPARYSLRSSTVLQRSAPSVPFTAPSPARFHDLPPEAPARNENGPWEDTSKPYDRAVHQINSYPVPLDQYQHAPFLPNFIQSPSARPRKFKSKYRDDVVFPRNTRSGPAWKKAKQLERTRQIHAPRVRKRRSRIFGVRMQQVVFTGETLVPSDECASQHSRDLSIYPSSSIPPTALATLPLFGDTTEEILSPVHPSSISSIPTEQVSRPSSPTATTTILRPQSSSHELPSPAQTPPQVHFIDDLEETKDDSALVAEINIRLNQDLVPEAPASSGTSASEESEHCSLMLSFIKPYLEFAESRMSSTYGQQEKYWEKVVRSLDASLTRRCLNEEQYLSIDYLLGLINDSKPGNEFNIVKYLRRLALYWNFREIARTYFNPLVPFDRL